MKKKVFWIIYYGVFTFLIVISLLVLWQYTILTWFSLFPVGYLFFALYMGISNPVKRLQGIKIYYNRRYAFWGWEEFDSSKSTTNKEIESKIALESEKKSAKLFLGFAPFIAIPIFFFSDIAKIVIGLVILTMLMLVKICLYDLVYSAKRYREEQDALDFKLRKEQEEQEFRNK